MIGVKQPIQDKLDEQTMGSRHTNLNTLELLTIIPDGATGEHSIVVNSNIYVQDLDFAIGTTSSVQAQLKSHNNSINALLGSVMTSDRILAASIGHSHGNNNKDTERLHDHRY